MLCAKDFDGLTPLHYCIYTGANRSVLEALLCIPQTLISSTKTPFTKPELLVPTDPKVYGQGRGIFHRKVESKVTTSSNLINHGRKIQSSKLSSGVTLKLRDIFHMNAIYDIVSGLEMMTFQQPKYALRILMNNDEEHHHSSSLHHHNNQSPTKRHSSKVTPFNSILLNKVAEPKTTASFNSKYNNNTSTRNQNLELFESSNRQFNHESIDLREVAWELSSRGMLYVVLCIIIKYHCLFRNISK